MVFKLSVLASVASLAARVCTVTCPSSAITRYCWTRYTRALVSYDNPANNYDTDVIAYADTALQRRLGDKPTEISAIGCTRASEAQRRAKWVVLSNSLDRTVSFKTGMEGRIPLPGFIIPIADSLLAGREIGGRISSSTARVVTLDRDTQAKAGDRLIINLPSGKAEGRTVQSVRGRAVTVTADYSELPVAQLQWALDADDLAIPLYRVLKVRRTTEGDYEISALQYEPSKFAAIDSGARLEERPISVIPVTTVQPPASVTLTSHSAIDQGIAINTMTIEWPAVSGAVAYDVEWRKDNGNWVKVQRTGATSVDVTGIYAGAYLARVRAVSAFDISSIWRSSMLTNLTGKVGLPPAVTSITTESLLFGIGVHWTFPPGAEDTQRTELWYSQGTDVSAATKLSDLAYPQSDYVLQNLRAGAAFFFWARLVDRTGNVGPFYPAGVGVRGESSSDAGAILDQIAGQVGESSLGKELAAEIGLISGIGPGSVNERLDEANALAEEARARLGEQIAAVDTELAGVKTELQQQIDTIADLADSMPYKADQTYTGGQGSLGADGIIYQAIKAVPINTPPPNTTYWLNVGQAVATANGLAARVQTVETKVTSVEGVNTSQAQQITGLRTDVDGKASGSSVQSLGNRVTTAENSISSQGSALTGLNNSLTTTNTNVSTAQTAANNAAALAGSKGKVMVQTAAPAAADQLAQNLWIDITGGANTPKRWNGSVWAPVTDKVATDAAAAAASALTQVQTKADAGAVAALTNRVTAAEGAVTSTSSNIVNLTNSIGAANSAGANIIPNPSLDPSFNQMGLAVVASSTARVPANCPFKYVARLASRDHLLNSAVVPYAATKPGDVWRMTALVACGTGAASFSLYARGGSDPVTPAVTLQGGALTQATSVWTRVTYDLIVPAGTYFIHPFLQVEQPVTGGSTIWYATDWHVENISAAKAAQATADATSLALSSLSSTVNQQGTTLTSVSSNIVSLTNSIGNAGGENLSWNPDFNKAASAANDLPDGYLADGPGAPGASTGVFALVPSFMNSAEKAQRITVTGINVSALYRSIRNAPNRLPKVIEGQPFCSSIYIKGTVGLGFRIFIQQINSAGGLITTTPSDMYYLTGSPQRIAMTIPSPMAGTTQIVMFYRVYGSATVSDGFIEMARPQVEYGSVPTGWSNNGQVESLARAATSSALDALTSSVTQQGATLTSVSGRTTSLENTINSTSNGLNTKASASAVNDLSNRVSSTEGVLTSQSSDITSLKNTIGSAGSFVAGVSYEFLSSNQGWAPQTAGATMTPGPLFSTLNKYTTVQRNGMAINGSENPFIRFRFKRKNTSRTSGAMYWANQDGGLAEARRANFTITGSEDWQDVEIDLSPNTGWVGKTINAIRLDFMNGGDASAIVDLGYVAAGRRSAAASAQAVSALTSEVTQQGATLTSQATQVASLQTAVGNANTAIQTEITARTNADTALGRRVDTVQSSVASANALIQSELSTRANADAALGQRIDTVQSSLGNTNASVQQTSTALAGLNGQVNAQYSVKVMTTTSGMKVAAGFGLGLESEGGVTQSTFAVSADRFVVLNSNLGGGATLSSPFAVENGQVFIADAYIKKATIQQGIVGQGLYSQTFTNYGAPVMNVDFDAGQILIQNRTTNGAYMFIRQDGIFMVQNGVVVVELSMG